MLLLALVLAAATVPVTSSSPEAVAAFEHGRALAEAQRWDEARPALQRAVKLDPAFPQALALLGKATPGPEGQAMLDRAVQLCAPLTEPERLVVQQMDAERRGEMDRSRNLALKLARLVPKDWRAQYLLGRIESYEEHLEAAEEAFRAAIALSPSAAPPHNILAFVRLRRGDPEGGVTAARRYVELSPGEPNPLDTLGEMLLCANHLPEAEAAFRRALSADARFWISWAGIAQTRFLRGDFEGGRAAIESGRAAATAPDLPRLAVYSAWSLFVEGRDAQALSALDALEASSKQHGDGRGAALAVAERARMLLESGKLEPARQEAARASAAAGAADLAGLDAEQLQAEARQVQLLAEARLGNLAEAQRLLEDVLAAARKAPYSARARSAVHLCRGEIALARHDAPRAVQELLACARSDQLCRFRRIEALRRAGDPSAAKERADFLAHPWRDQVQFGEAPMYLFGRARLLSEMTHR